MLKESDVNILKQGFTFWDKLSEAQERLILDHVIVGSYSKGMTIHNGQDDCVGVFVLKTGEFRAYILSDEGKEITIYRLRAGDICILSASCILKNITFDVHIDIELDSEVLLINSNIYQKIVDQNIYVENFTYKLAMDKFSEVMWAMEQILFMSFDKRLAIFLQDEANQNHSDEIALTHEQIAKYIGSAREVVSRMLKYFAQEGIVELSRGGIKITDRKKLKSRINNQY